jgi:endonuclease/exonuclease/phosphatase (EEP) superfamily protein YafD
MKALFNLMSRRNLAWLIAAGAGGLVLLGWLGAQVPRLDALAAFRWHAVALFGLAMAAVAWPSRAAAIACLSPFVILGVPVAMALRPASAPAIVASPVTDARKSLRIITFNTWDHVRNIDEAHAMLRAVDADVVVLVEISPPKRALLEVLKPLYPHQVHCAAFWPCSMALLSKLPFEAHGAVLPSMTMPAAVWGRIAGEAGQGEGLTIIGVHVHRPTRSTRVHWGHMQGVAGLTAKAKGAVVVAGDFNTPAWSASMDWLRRTTGLRTMPRILPTWPAWPVFVPQFPIDHILVSGDLRLEDVATGPAAGSDHLPVLGTVVLPHPLRRAQPVIAAPPRPSSPVSR